MSPLATVVIPTHDHGPTLRQSVGSVLAQTVSDLEILVVGDGVPSQARPVLDEVAAWDERVRVFLNPKSPRTGEPWRRAALERARGTLVLYLSDDDLWFPEHVEHMAELLSNADFAHALPLRVDPDGTLRSGAIDLSLPGFSARMLAGRNWIPFSCGTHTMEAYRRLQSGWETTPKGIWTDLYMWQKFLRLEGVRLASATRPTVLHFPSSQRGDWSLEARTSELERWAARVADSDWRREFVFTALAEVVRASARKELRILRLLDGVAARERKLDQLEGTLTWRLRERALTLAPIGMAAKARARRAGRRARARSSPAR